MANDFVNSFLAGRQVRDERQTAAKRDKFNALAGSLYTEQNRAPVLSQMAEVDAAGTAPFANYFAQQDKAGAAEAKTKDQEAAKLSLYKANLVRTAPKGRKIALWQQVAPEHYQQMVADGTPPTDEEIDMAIDQGLPELHQKAGIEFKPDVEKFTPGGHDVVLGGKPAVAQFGDKGSVRQIEGATPYNKPTNVGGGGSALDTDTLELVAQDYLKTGKLPPLYRDNETKIIIMKRAAQIAKDSGNDAAATVIDRQSFAAGKASLSKVTAQKNMVGSFEKTFQKNLDLALNLSQKVDRTGSPLINRAVMAWKQGVSGDAETKGFINALTTARTEYAKILSGATGAAGITDAGRKEAEELFSKVDSPETLAYVAEVAKQEAGNRMSSFDEQIAEITGSMGNKTPQKPAASTAQPEITATGPNGQKVVLRNGQWVPM